ncbi:YfaZ family outer membrane protein [Sulfurimonas sp.]
MLKKITLTAVSAATAFAMNSASININNEDLELSANLDIGQFNENVTPETMFVGVRFLDADNSNTINNDALYELSFLMKKEMAESALNVGLSVKANYTKDYASLPLGITFEYGLPSVTVVPMSLHADVYYAPKVLAFKNADKYFEYRVEYDAEVIEHGYVIVGYRHITTDYNDVRGNFTYNASAYIGFNFEF